MLKWRQKFNKDSLENSSEIESEDTEVSELV